MTTQQQAFLDGYLGKVAKETGVKAYGSDIAAPAKKRTGMSKILDEAISPYLDQFNNKAQKAEKDIKMGFGMNAMTTMGTGFMQNMASNKRHKETMTAIGNIGKGSHPARPAPAYRLTGKA